MAASDKTSMVKILALVITGLAQGIEGIKNFLEYFFNLITEKQKKAKYSNRSQVSVLGKL